MGATTQFVPVWSGVALHSRPLASVQLVLVVAGLVAFVASLLAGTLVLLVAFGVRMVAGFWEFVYNVGRTALYVDGRDVCYRGGTGFASPPLAARSCLRGSSCSRRTLLATGLRKMGEKYPCPVRGVSSHLGKDRKVLEWSSIALVPPVANEVAGMRRAIGHSLWAHVARQRTFIPDQYSNDSEMNSIRYHNCVGDATGQVGGKEGAQRAWRLAVSSTPRGRESQGFTASQLQPYCAPPRTPSPSR